MSTLMKPEARTRIMPTITMALVVALIAGIVAAIGAVGMLTPISLVQYADARACSNHFEAGAPTAEKENCSSPTANGKGFNVNNHFKPAR
jgi:hypothetical protein